MEPEIEVQDIKNMKIVSFNNMDTPYRAGGCGAWSSGYEDCQLWRYGHLMEPEVLMREVLDVKIVNFDVMDAPYEVRGCGSGSEDRQWLMLLPTLREILLLWILDVENGKIVNIDITVTD